MKVIKIGNVELTEAEALKIYQEQKYIITYSKIYQLFYSAAQRTIYGNVIYQQPGLTKRGRFYTFTAAEVNRLLGYQLVNE